MGGKNGETHGNEWEQVGNSGSPGETEAGTTEKPRADMEPIDWEARLRASVEETLRKREAKRAERQMFAVRRMHGLAARHAAKLARIEKERGEQS